MEKNFSGWKVEVDSENFEIDGICVYITIKETNFGPFKSQDQLYVFFRDKKGVIPGSVLAHKVSKVIHWIINNGLDKKDDSVTSDMRTPICKGQLPLLFNTLSH